MSKNGKEKRGSLPLQSIAVNALLCNNTLCAVFSML